MRRKQNSNITASLPPPPDILLWRCCCCCCLRVDRKRARAQPVIHSNAETDYDKIYDKNTHTRTYTKHRSLSAATAAQRCRNACHSGVTAMWFCHYIKPMTRLVNWIYVLVKLRICMFIKWYANIGVRLNVQHKP